MLTSQQLEIMETVKNNTCKYCERIVLAGPPCCYQALYDLWLASQKEVKWLRKIQSRQARRLEWAYQSHKLWEEAQKDLKWLRKIQGKQTRRIQDLLENSHYFKITDSTLLTIVLFLAAIFCFRH